MTHSMRMLISLLTALVLSTFALPGAPATAHAATVGAAPFARPHAAQGRRKKGRAGRRKAKKVDKIDKKPKKNDRGFEL